MHHLYFTRVARNEAKTSQEAIRKAEQILEINNFVGEGGYFSSSKCDWFVIGGRWSGVFSQLLTTEKKKQQFVDKMISYLKANKQLEKLYKDSQNLPQYLYMNTHLIPMEIREKTIEDIDKISKETVGYVYFRDNYKSDGFNDDAIRLTPKIITKLKKQYPDIEIFDYENFEEYEVSKLENNCTDWLVAIDYHD